MLDVIFPVHSKNLELLASDPGWGDDLEGAIPRALRPIDVPFRATVVAQGGDEKEFPPVISDALSQSAGNDYVIFHEPKVLGYEAAVKEGIKQTRNPIVAIVPPYAWIDDVKWFGKMQRVFELDGRAHLVTALDRRTDSSTLPPARFPNLACGPSPVVLLAKRDAMASFSELMGKWAASIQAAGGSRWEHPGVVIEPQPFEPHEPSSEKRRRHVAAGRRSGK